MANFNKTCPPADIAAAIKGSIIEELILIILVTFIMYFE
jgi:hypothetical protein